MAIDPATAKLIAKAAVSVASDERMRKVILIAALTPLIIILLVLSSPFAIFFSLTDGGDEQVSVTSVVFELKESLATKIEAEINDPKADEVNVVYLGSEENEPIDNSSDALFVFSAKYNIAGENSQQLAVLNEEKISNLKSVYWDMNVISIEEENISETVTNTTTDDDDKEVTKTETVSKTIKTIYINSLTAEEAGVQYGFDEIQMQVMEEMRKSGMTAMLMNGSIPLFLSASQIEEIHAYLPADFEIEREEIVKTAESLVGRVQYFWGGKSTAIGWDNRWGTDMEVTSPGSPSTGTIRSFGLDCSGYVTWVFANMGLPVDTIEETIGHGTTKQWNVSNSISENMVLPGDLAFLAIPGTRKVNHVGIVVGRNENNEILVIHCSSAANGVDISMAKNVGFLYFRRPAILIKP